MKIPEAARQDFDQLMKRPLPQLVPLRKEMRAFVALLEKTGAESDADTSEALEVANTLLQLVSAIERKTSPLYIRLICTAMAYITRHDPENPSSMLEADWELNRKVLSSVPQYKILSVYS